ncbi:MAG: DUF262 domain-containing protein [Bacteroidales bacterium]|nr:DUF262 domain-containing protein [Bacteroidales bacterium]
MCINNNIKTKAIQEFSDYNFFVDDYQRGYKWTVQQVLDLLKDIASFDRNKEIFYCLQPLAVKTRNWKEGENEIVGYEVIDGQQRLTTIFMILKVLEEDLYSLQYQTRKNSAKFLNQIDKNISEDFTIEFEDDIIKLSTILNEKWGKFSEINDNKDYDNIDIYHFFCAFLLIKSFFVKNNEIKGHFKENLKDYTRFIWYEDNKSQDSKQVFRNLNSGKIPLTNAELIKALFINSLKDRNKEIQELQQNNFAGEWDKIEQDLHDNKFWFFINNDTNEDSYQTRIDFLFEILVDKPPKDKKDNLYTYRHYASNKEKLIWNEIKELYLKLQEWYSDSKTYHLIGFIIDRRFSNIKKLVNISNDRDITKIEFETKLVGIIQANLGLMKKVQKDSKSIESINFEDNYNDVKNVLLLFNIEQYQNSITGFRFPFDEFKNTKWTIEHIHAQNADDFETLEEIEAWLTELENIINDFAEFNEKNDELSNKVKELRAELNKLKDNKTEKFTEELILKLKETIALTSEFLKVHKINNLALLDGPTNSGLGKKAFPNKRKYILDIDKKQMTRSKVFIPLATINVFQKYYTKEVRQNEFWGYQDRKDYMDIIEKTLEKYLIDEEKEEGKNE